MNPRHAVLEWMWEDAVGSGGGPVLAGSLFSCVAWLCGSLWFGFWVSSPVCTCCTPLQHPKRTRNRPKRAKLGAFWVLEGMAAVANRCERIEKTGKLGGNRGTDLSRLPPRVLLPSGERPAPTEAGAETGAAERHWRSLTPRHAPQESLRAHLVAKSYRTLTKKSGTAEAIPDFFGRGRRT